MLAISYIILVSGLFVFVLRYVPEPNFKATTDPFFGLFMLGCYLMGGMFGFMLPEAVAPYIGLTWGHGSLERAAEIFGAVGGFLIAARGVVIWGTLFVLGGIAYGGLALWGFIFNH